MKPNLKELIFKDDDISVYEYKYIDYVPNNMRIGGIIYVVNNHNNEQRHKEWKWFKHEDGTMFNDKDYVIDMLYEYVRKLEIEDEF